jgi:hypothetical protein
VYPALDLYASVLLLIAASAVVGQGVLCACGRRTWSWLAPAVGLATLVILAGATIRLPGRDLTATAVVGVVLAASIALLWVRRPKAPEAFRIGLPVAIAIVVAASLPFVAAGGFGVFVGKSRDFGYYLYDAQWLQTHAGFRPPQIVKGFPMGPPALAAVTAKVAGGASLVATFTAFMIAVAVAAALASLTVFGKLAAGRRTLAAFLVGLPYLGASFYVQSSFKEVAMGLFALAFALSLRELAGEDRPEGVVSPGSLAGVVPLGLLAAAGVYTYSFAGTYWPLGTLGLWVLALVLLNRSRLRVLIRTWRPGVPRSRRARVLVAVVVVAVLAAGIPEWSQIIEFARARGSLSAVSGGSGSNVLPGTPWFYTALGVWPDTDYRVGVPNMLVERLLFAVALLALARGLVLLWRRRELALLAAAVTAGTLYLAALFGSGPYVQSKALAIMAPLTMLVAVYGALAVFPSRRSRGRTSTAESAADGARGAAERLLAAPLVWGAVAIVFLAGALLSTYLALGGALINGGEQARQLEALGREVQGSTVLFLGSDDYVGWELRGASVFSSDRGDVGTESESGVVLLPPKATPSPYWTRYDFDSMTARELDLADFVISARSPLMSEPPRNFKRIAATDSFVLWKRVGPTRPRRTLLEGPLPGRELACGTARGRRLSRSHGIAHVWSPAPVFGGSAGWSASGRSPAAGSHRQPALLALGHSLTHGLDLGRGRWAISLQYTSTDPLRVQGPGLDARLPPNFQRLGSFWRVGTITQRKRSPAIFRVEIEPRSALRDLLSGPDRLDTGSYSLRLRVGDVDAGRGVLLAGIAATRVGTRRTTVPLRLACGRFVDWYRQS